MSERTSIEWTDATWNPLRGTKGKWHCSKVSPGCHGCYAERINVRFGGPEYKRGADTFRLDERALTLPLRWRKPRRVFTCSMTDLFHEDVPDEFIDRVFAVMALAPRHTFQVLTKRAERMAAYCNPNTRMVHCKVALAELAYPELLAQEIRRAAEATDDPDGYRRRGDHAVRWPLPNVWCGVSVERQQEADERIPHLLRTPAAVRFLSVEPMLGPIEFSDVSRRSDAVEQLGRRAIAGIHWIICGGESGPGARPMHPDWARGVRDQCKAAGVPFFFKQWGEWAPQGSPHHNPHGALSLDGSFQELPKLPHGIGRHHDHRFATVYRVGKHAAGNLLDGARWAQFPEAMNPSEEARQDRDARAE